MFSFHATCCPFHGGSVPSRGLFRVPVASPHGPCLARSFPPSLPPQVMDFFKLPANAAIALVDEVALDFGQLRLKAKGGAGGHNGLKSLQSHLKTPEYTRLRIGVGGEVEMLCSVCLPRPRQRR